MTTETPTSGIARATAPSELGASESEHRDTVNLDALDLEGLKRVAELDLSKPPFTEDGVGWRLMRAEAAYAEEYALSTEGADHEPTEFERELLTDYWGGLISDERFFGIIRGLAARAQVAETQLESVKRERDEARQSLKWVDQVYPRRRDGGAWVSMTWEEFNGLRGVIGLKPLNPLDGGVRSARGDMNLRLRLALQSAQAELKRMREALRAAKREMWDIARHTWALADFKNWAVIQQIDAALQTPEAGDA